MQARTSVVTSDLPGLEAFFVRDMEVPIRLMSDCSGAEGSWWALQELLHHSKCVHASSKLACFCLKTCFFLDLRCDNAVGPLKFLLANCRPKKNLRCSMMWASNDPRIFPDMEKRSLVKEVNNSNTYSCGFPCTPQLV